MALQASLIAGGMASFVGALAGVMIIGGRLPTALSVGWSTPDAPLPPLDQRLNVGGFLLAAHAITAAALWQAPTLGSCFAAGLGAGWIGAAAAGLVGLMGRTDRLNHRVASVVFGAMVGFALMAPLWAYVQVMRMHIGGPHL